MRIATQLLFITNAKIKRVYSNNKLIVVFFNINIHHKANIV